MQGGAKLGREVVPLPLGMTSRYLRVVPSKLEFKNVESGLPLVATISVQNISALPRRVRVAIPKVQEFAVRYTPLPAMAPGMQCQIEVKFYTDAPEPESIHSSFVIAVEGDEIIVPLIAEPAKPDVRFESFCAFGQVNVGSTEIRYVELVNYGSKECDFALHELTASKNIEVEPLKGSLGPDRSDNNVVTLKVTVEAADVGFAQSVFQVLVDGRSSGNTLDVSANICRCVFNVSCPLGGGICTCNIYIYIYI